MATVLQHSKRVVYCIGTSSNLGILHESQNGPFTPSLKVKISYSWGAALNPSWNTKKVWNWPSPTIGRWLKPLCWRISSVFPRWLWYCQAIYRSPSTRYVDKLPKTIAGTVKAILEMKDEKKMQAGSRVPSSKICGYFPLWFPLLMPVRHYSFFLFQFFQWIHISWDPYDMRYDMSRHVL